jgi:hypothetical protein
MLKQNLKTGIWNCCGFASLERSPVVLHAGFVTIRLQPQMKKYRSLWCMSTTNHNILYFVRVSSTTAINTAIWLWKAQNRHERRGFGTSMLPQNLMQPPAREDPSSPLKPSPGASRPQGAEVVQIGRNSVEMWRFRQKRLKSGEAYREVGCW